MIGFSLTGVRRIFRGVRRRQAHARFARRLTETLDPVTRPRSSASIAGKLSFPARTAIADFVSGLLRTPHPRAPGRLLTHDRRAEKGKIVAGCAMTGKLRLSAETELDRAGAGPGCATSKALPASNVPHAASWFTARRLSCFMRPRISNG
jgi:hypothetical protein